MTDDHPSDHTAGSRAMTELLRSASRGTTLRVDRTPPGDSTATAARLVADAARFAETLPEDERRAFAAAMTNYLNESP